MPLLRRGLAVFLFLTACLAQTPAQTLAIQGLNGTAASLDAGDFARLPQHAFEVSSHGATVKFEGALLKDVLAKVDLPLGEKFHSTAASYYVIVEAKDGYRAVFAWAEADPGFMEKALYVVTKRDGKPLSERDGPFQLVVPGEKRDGRWVRQLTKIRLQQAN